MRRWADCEALSAEGVVGTGLGAFASQNFRHTASSAFRCRLPQYRAGAVRPAKPH
jgi:hypothetical protein